MEAEFTCADCRKRNEFESNTDSLKCEYCNRDYGKLNDFVSDAGLLHCGVCGCRDMYIQKDFNRKTGVAIAVIGAVLAPFTKFISLLVCALIDLILYKVLPMITICYRCHSIFRELPVNPEHQGFNLGINDRYRAAERT